MTFKIEYKDPGSSARTGTISTAHGDITTPVFMPVGTQGTVKGVHQHELENIVKAQIILGNTYHLYLRPGVEILQKAGGLHKFMNWNKPILTDRRGCQISVTCGWLKTLFQSGICHGCTKNNRRRYRHGI